MGAGCYYTTFEGKFRAVWIKPKFEGEEEEIRDDMEDFFVGCRAEIEDLSSKFFKFFGEGTYYGDGMVVRMEPTEYALETPSNYALACHMAETIYSSRLRKLPYTSLMHIATSGYTSTKYEA